jgi:aspartyl-tRNA(Asn)/glutamyl-tRNA(Gln) amidotransferase subunit B
MPAERRARLAELAGTGSGEVATVVDLQLDDLVLAAVDAGADAKLAVRRVTNEVAADPVRARELDATAFAKLIVLEDSGVLTPTQAKQVLVEMLDGGGDPEAIARERGFEAMDAGALTTVLDEAIAGHPDEWARLRDGDQKLMGFFVGLVMKATRGQADGKAVSALLRQRER